MKHTLDDWIGFWNDDVKFMSIKTHRSEVNFLGATVYPDISGTVAAIRIDDKDDIIERNGEVYAHILQKDYFNSKRLPSVKSHMNDVVVYNAYMMMTTIKLFPVSHEIMMEVFVGKKAPAFLSNRDYDGWAMLVMPMIPREDGNYGGHEELPRERKETLKRWM